MYARDVQLVASGLNAAEDEIEPLVGIILKELHLEIRCLIVISEIDHAPFDIENAIGKRTADRCENALAGTRAMGPQIRPARGDDVVPIEDGAGRSVVM